MHLGVPHADSSNLQVYDFEHQRLLEVIIMLSSYVAIEGKTLLNQTKLL